MKRIFGLQPPPPEPTRTETAPEVEPEPAAPDLPQKRTLGALGLVNRSHLERLARIRAAEYNQRQEKEEHP